ncbi:MULTISPECIES: DUF7269 family protein [Halorussus]|uniref:DUF7269 family protein n=1 Tax=Halorussus TaxID=1070314 RepID=UPI00209F4E03|nr:hypothetical protein [Halorussus vallis]USZ77907.1 hypothetical protein NGM07_22265 [Halorussus vallis]
MRFRTTVVGGVGVVFTIATAGVLLAPDRFAPLVAALGQRDPERQLLLLGGLVGAYAVWSARRRRSPAAPEDAAAKRFERARRRPPETVTLAAGTLTGADFDATVEAAVAGREPALERVSEELVETAVEAYARAEECSPETARRSITAGAWTDDPVAAAFLGGEEGPRYPLWARLRGWLDPSAERDRRIRRTIAALRPLRTPEGESR